ncbi:MAG: hypothetical protein C5B57_09930, partial [Blastocatellia bacterium]
MKHRYWQIAALFLALALVATYPVIRAPASYAYFGHSDAQLNMWIMAWEAHALRVDPRNFFNGNIFFPELRTIAYSEVLLGYFPLFAPILWLGGTPALAFNTVLLTSFVASGFCMYLLTRHLTGRNWPAVVAGIVYAFLPYRFVHIPQIQLEAMEWLPLAFLFLHLFVERGSPRYAAGLVVAIVFGTLCCVYYGVFMATALIIAVPLLAVIEQRAREVRKLATLAAVAAIAALILTPVFLQYVRVNRTLGLERSIEEITLRSADLDAYLSSTAPIHQALGRPLLPPPNDFLFPGVVALCLAGIGVLAVARRPVAALYLAVAACGLLASLGPRGLYGVSMYQLLYTIGPMFRGLRQV